MVNNLSIAVYDFPMNKLTLLSVDGILLPRYDTWRTNLRRLWLNVEMLIKCYYLKRKQLYGHLPPISKTIQINKDMQATVGEVRASSEAAFFCGLLRTDVHVLNIWLELIYNSSVQK